jgi:hypothetical protein
MHLNVSAVAGETTVRQHHSGIDSATTTRTSFMATSGAFPDTRNILKNALRMSKFLFTLLLLWTAVVVPRNETNSLEFPFTLVVGNLSVIPPIFVSDEKMTPELGEKAAIFHLKDGRLTSDQHLLARHHYEHQAMYPHPVYWYKKGQTNSPLPQLETTAKGNDDGSLQVYLFGKCGYLPSLAFACSDLGTYAGAPIIGYPSTRRLEADTTGMWLQNEDLGSDAVAVYVKPVK